METVNILIKKLKYKKEIAFENAINLLNNTNFKEISASTLFKAFEISIKYSFSHWDSLIIASALEAQCTVLYSEDMNHGQVIENTLTIINPFN